MSAVIPIASKAARSSSQRGQGTRVAIEQAALRLFSTRTPDAVTIDDIVREASVAKGTFYNHFTDKSVLVGSLIVAVREWVEPIIGEANAGISDPAARLARGMAVYARFALDQPERALVLTLVDDGQLSASSKLNRGLIDDLSTGLASGRFAFATVDSAVLFVSGIARALVLQMAREKQMSFAISTSQQITAMLLRGLGVEWAEADKISAYTVNDVVRGNCTTVTGD